MRSREAGHKFSPENLDRLMSDERRRLTDPERLFDMFPLADDQVVADVGCGPGFFAIPLARRLSKGKVYAFDVQDEMVRAAQANVASSGLANVEAARCDESRLPLAAGTLDGAYLAFVFHEIEGSLPDYVAMLRERLKPGGWLAVVEWKREPMEEGPPLHERLAEREIREIGEAGGMTFSSQADVNDKQYLVLFTNGSV